LSQPVLQVKDLKTQFFTDDGVVQAVDGITFDLHPGETLGIVGESGCGKSVTALSILRLVQEPGRIVGGEILFRGTDLVRMPEDDVREIRGKDIAMIFQDPLSSLNPVLRVGFQIAEAIAAHERVPGKVALDRAVQLLKQVRIPAAESRIRDYPHQFSGGMRQRAMIAMALANKPSILIADEPTTALDVTVQAQILELLRDLNEDLKTAIILITHNMGVVAGLCSRVIVMYAGRIVEEGPVERIFKNPQHPYTWSLLQSMPRLDSDRAKRLLSIEGLPPDLIAPPRGCRFNPRCQFKIEKCLHDDPPLMKVGPDQEAACWVTMSRALKKNGQVNA
jgi:oligopeptide/dipeptide ABC transporter ATP-binding protein